MNFQTIEQDITPILEQSEAARCDDMALYANYVYIKLNSSYVALNGMKWLERVFSDRRFRIDYGIATYGAVSRARRKLQAIHEELRPDQDYKEERRRAELEYKRYAREKGGGADE